MKTRQFCSVCKEWLDMAVVPTGDGEEDDGVIWFRCPQCQGFLPKLKSAADGGDGPEPDAEPAGGRSGPLDGAPRGRGDGEGSLEGEPSVDQDVDPSWDSPAAMTAARAGGVTEPAGDLEDGFGPDDLVDVAEDLDDTEDDEADDEADDDPNPTAPVEELAGYAAMLQEADLDAAVPYRPWETYEVGQCVIHLAWNDCGVVVAKETLPGGRRAIKCFFTTAGVIRLIENAPR
ncbi:MAG: hypothetical protein AB7V45_15400 [Candidatus Krumholzibacteriia bacterium]